MYFPDYKPTQEEIDFEVTRDAMIAALAGLGSDVQRYNDAIVFLTERRNLAQFELEVAQEKYKNFIDANGGERVYFE